MIRVPNYARRSGSAMQACPGGQGHGRSTRQTCCLSRNPDAGDGSQWLTRRPDAECRHYVVDDVVVECSESMSCRRGKELNVSGGI